MLSDDETFDQSSKKNSKVRFGTDTPTLIDPDDSITPFRSLK